VFKPRQAAAAGVEGGQRVGEAGRFGLRGNGFDLGPVFGQGSVEGGREVLGRDGGEGRQAVGRGPVLHQGVGAVHAGISQK
jgi:hypothetical protein